MDPKYTVAITIVNYNTRELSSHCIKKIYEADINVPFQIIFLDNASTDGRETIEDIKDAFPEVNIIAEDTNTGYTRGVNTCVKKADAKYIFNMNSDAILEPGAIDTMIEYMEKNPDVGLLGPQLLNMDDTIQESCYRFVTPEIALYRRTILGHLPSAKKKLEKFLMKDMDWTKTQEVDWVLGAAILFPKSLIEKVGHLDEDLFLYLSDTYYAWQMWEQGYKVVYFPEVKLYHYHRKSSRQQFFLKRLFFNKAYRIHIRDGITYFRKTWGKSLPHS